MEHDLGAFPHLRSCQNINLGEGNTCCVFVYEKVNKILKNIFTRILKNIKRKNQDRIHIGGEIFSQPYLSAPHVFWSPTPT